MVSHRDPRRGEGNGRVTEKLEKQGRSGQKHPEKSTSSQPLHEDGKALTTMRAQVPPAHSYGSMNFLSIMLRGFGKKILI